MAKRPTRKTVRRTAKKTTRRRAKGPDPAVVRLQTWLLSQYPDGTGCAIARDARERVSAAIDAGTKLATLWRASTQVLKDHFDEFFEADSETLDYLESDEGYNLDDFNAESTRILTKFAPHLSADFVRATKAEIRRVAKAMAAVEREAEKRTARLGKRRLVDFTDDYQPVWA